MNRIAFLLFGLLLIGSAVYAQSAQSLLQRADAETDSVKAIALYSQLLNQYPRTSAAYYGRAIVRRRAGQVPEALVDMNQAIGIEPQRPDFYAQRAFIYLQLYEYDLAARDIKQAITLAPTKADYYSTLSYCQTKQGRYDDAEKTAQQGIDLNPASPFSYRNRGRARLYKGQPDAAIADFQAALQRNHREPFRVYSDLGEAYQQKKQFPEALRNYNQSLALRPGYPDALVLKHQLELQLATSTSPTPTPPATTVAASTFAGRRVALVIGNSKYQFANGLGGQPVNDAQAMKTRLADLGFTVEIVTDANRQTVQAALAKFTAQALGSDVALLFYAGHGIEYHGTNYLLPVDTRLDESHPEAIEDQALSIPTLIDRLQGTKPRFCIVLLDACRSDPFTESKNPAPSPAAPVANNVPPVPSAQPGRAVTTTPKPSPSNAGGGGTARGFKKVQVENQILNCYVGLATAPGETAGNGPRQNGYYTEALLKNLRRGRRLDEVLRAVRIDVIEQTKKTPNLQQPEYLAKANEDIIL